VARAHGTPWGVLLMGVGASFWGDEKVLELDGDGGGDGGPALRVH
jgi:hypothetical protein